MCLGKCEGLFSYLKIEDEVSSPHLVEAANSVQQSTTLRFGKGGSGSKDNNRFLRTKVNVAFSKLQAGGRLQRALLVPTRGARRLELPRSSSSYTHRCV